MSADEETLLAATSLASWETNASFWDSAVGQGGNLYWRVLQEPCLGRLLDGHLRRPGGCRALDLATGNGLCARWMAARGASAVVATDGTEAMLEVARARAAAESAAVAAKIEFRKLDVTRAEDFAALLSDQNGVFDVVLINMAVMDIATIEPLAEALPRLLKQDGVFVCTMLHPVFHTSRASRAAEVHDDRPGGGRDIEHTMVLRGYEHVPPWEGWAIMGQPAQQYYFHRPLHELFGTFFKHGMAMDALEEPTFGEEHRNSQKIESVFNYWQFPPLMAFRLRRAA